jgi:signal transduction histidine kinase
MLLSPATSASVPPAASPLPPLAELVSWTDFFASTGLGLVVLGTDLAVQALNPMAEQLTGWTADDAIGQDGRVVLKIRSPRHLRLRGLLNRVQAGQCYPCHGEPGQIARLVTRDNAERSVSLQVLAPRPGAAILLVLQEVPHRRLTPHCARDFLAAVGHELRTPLTALRGFADLLIAKPDLPPETRAEFLRILGGEVTRLSELVDGVLEMSRLEVGAVLPKLGPVAPGTVLAAVLQRHQRAAAGRQVTLEAQIAPGLADVWTDQSRLVRIMEELVGNALKFTPAGGHVTARLAMEAQDLCLVVEDSGPGIPAGDEERIFEQFHRGKGSAKGAGLGLSLVRGNVELLGGTVTAANVPGGGARLEVRLPWEDLLPD